MIGYTNSFVTILGVNFLFQAREAPGIIKKAIFVSYNVWHVVETFYYGTGQTGRHQLGLRGALPDGACFIFITDLKLLI